MLTYEKRLAMSVKKKHSSYLLTINALNHFYSVFDRYCLLHVNTKSHKLWIPCAISCFCVIKELPNYPETICHVTTSIFVNHLVTTLLGYKYTVVENNCMHMRSYCLS